MEDELEGNQTVKPRICWKDRLFRTLFISQGAEVEKIEGSGKFVNKIFSNKRESICWRNKVLIWEVDASGEL